MEKITYALCRDGAKPPVKKHAGDSCYDLSSSIDKDIIIPPLGRESIPLGVKFKLPPGIEGQVRPRSGLAKKYGLTVLNTPGTIDSNYRGEVEAIIVNLGQDEVRITDGLRLCQIAFAPVLATQLDAGRVELDTDRGANGFGSTGY